MKRISIFIFTLLLFSSCVQRDSEVSYVDYKTELIGTWVKKKDFVSMNNPSAPFYYEWVDAKVPDNITFTKNLDFIDSKFDNCNKGLYNVNHNIIKTEINCNGSLYQRTSEVYISESDRNKLFIFVLDKDCKEFCTFLYERIR